MTCRSGRTSLRQMSRVGRALESGSLLVETDHRARYRKIREDLINIRAQL